MRSLVPSALLAAVVMALLLTMPQRAHAGAGVVRCAIPDGSHVYTSKACSAFAIDRWDRWVRRSCETRRPRQAVTGILNALEQMRFLRHWSTRSLRA